MGSSRKEIIVLNASISKRNKDLNAPYLEHELESEFDLETEQVAVVPIRMYPEETLREFSLQRDHGAWLAIPGLEYLKIQYVGPAVPARSQYHQVCEICARGGTLNEAARDSTSSSSEE